MQFVPFTPATLASALAGWIDRRVERLGSGSNPEKPQPGRVFGFDGAPEVGTAELADRVAEVLRGVGRPALRASTDSWWRPAALRLELGRQDVDMLLTGWVDVAALRRELFGPVAAGTGTFITRLRDPVTDRPIRQPAAPTPPGAVLLLDGPFLLAADLPLEALVGVQVSTRTVRRALAAEKSWWTAGFEQYEREYRPSERADVLLAYDHPRAPAAAGLPDGARR